MNNAREYLFGYSQDIFLGSLSWLLHHCRRYIKLSHCYEMFKDHYVIISYHLNLGKVVYCIL